MAVAGLLASCNFCIDALVPSAGGRDGGADDLAAAGDDLAGGASADLSSPAPIFSTLSLLAGGNAGFADGLGGGAKFHNPNGIAVDPAGNLYVADTTNQLVRKIDPSAQVTTLAGQ